MWNGADPLSAGVVVHPVVKPVVAILSREANLWDVQRLALARRRENMLWPRCDGIRNQRRLNKDNSNTEE